MHGLLGSHKHMHSIRDLIIARSNEPVMIMIPCKNGFFKTFDGIDIVGERVLKEIKLFLRSRNENEIKSLQHLNIVAYSMGGLISKYIIKDLKVFLDKRYPHIKFNTFMTIASPHLGVNFYKNGKFPYNVLTSLGSNVLGRSGRQLFILDNENNTDPLLLKISKGKYLEALKSFKHHVSLANVQNDRTVSFYTSFITDLEYQCNINALENDSILTTWDKFPTGAVIDVTREGIANDDSLTFGTKGLFIRLSNIIKYLAKCFIIIMFVFFIFPIVLVVNLFGTALSHLSVWIYQNKMLLYSKFSFLNKKWLSAKLDLDLDPDSDFDEEYDNDVMEQLLSHLDKTRSDESLVKNDIADIISSDWEMKKTTYGKDSEGTIKSSKHSNLRMKYFINKYKHNNETDLYKRITAESLPFDAARNEIYNNLNSIEWIRIPLKLKGANTHRAIIARNGLDPTLTLNRQAINFNIDLLLELCANDHDI